MLVQLAEAVAELTARVELLEERDRRSSRNSSMPPSSDLPSVKKPRRSGQASEPSARKQGAQAGHKGSHRAPFLPERVDERVELDVDCCAHCGSQDVRRDGAPWRHQVAELPPVSVIVTEYLLHRVRCRDCRKRTRASLPAGVTKSAFGARLTGYVGALGAHLRLSAREVSELLADVHACPISPGAVIETQRRLSAALMAPYQELDRYIDQQPSANADETSFRNCGRKTWAWTKVTPLAAFLRIDRSRSKDAAKALLAAFQGVLGCDRYAAYNFVKLLQHCWSHLQRDFQKVSEREADADLGKRLLDQTTKLFRTWHQFINKHHSRSWLKQRMRPIRERIEVLLSIGQGIGTDKTRGLCRDLLGRGDALWRFVTTPGVEPTNNAAERALRHLVILRKTKFHTQSEAGDRYLERTVTARQTLRLQNRSVFEYFQAATTAHFHGRSPPSLLPTT